MILVFCSVFVLLWVYLKLFPRLNRSKMILTVMVFSILFSFLVSFLSVSGVYGPYGSSIRALVPNNPVLAQFSLPFYLEVEYGPAELMTNSGFMFLRIFFAKAQLVELEFGTKAEAERGYIYVGRQFDVDYTMTLFYQLLLIFTAFNMIGALLAAFTYKLSGKFAKNLISRIS